MGKAHLEGFGGFEGVKKGKGELFDYLAWTGGVAFVNANEPHLEEMSREVAKRMFYTKSEDPDRDHAPYEIKLLKEKPLLTVAFLDWAGHLKTCHTQLVGRYNFNNIMTAVALGKYFKVPADGICRAIEAYVPENNRSQLLKINSNTIVLDAYNANPSSMQHAIQNLTTMNARYRVAILGDMLELGDYSRAEHRKVAQLALASGVDAILLVGAEFSAVASELELPCCGTVEEAAQWLGKQHFAEALILIKGSRGMKLEKLVESSQGFQ